MGLFSQYRKPRNDVHGAHPHNLVHKTITAHAGETLTIRVEGGHPVYHQTEIARQKEVKGAFGQKPGGPHEDAKYIVKEGGKVSHELQRRRNAQEHPATLADYIAR